MEVLSKNPFEIFLDSIEERNAGEGSDITEEANVQASASGESCISIKLLASACFKMSFILPVEELCDVL